MTTPDSSQRTRRIYRSRTDRILGGVAGGMAQYLGVDPVLIRLALVALLFAGIGFLLYIVAWIIIPEEPLAGEAPAPEARPEGAGRAGPDGQTARMIAGGLLVAVGALLLLDWAFDALNVGRFIWPVAIIVFGVGLFTYGARK
jgi:phage shock protein C